MGARGAEAGKKSEVIQKSTLNREHRIKSVHVPTRVHVSIRVLNTRRVHYHETRLYSRWHTNAIVVDHLWPVGHCKICTAGRKYSKHTVHSIKPSPSFAFVGSCRLDSAVGRLWGRLLGLGGCASRFRANNHIIWRFHSKTHTATGPEARLIDGGPPILQTRTVSRLSHGR